MLDLHDRTTLSVITAISVAVICAVIFLVWAFGPYDSLAAGTVQFTVQQGWGGGRIAGELESAGLIRWTWAFIFFENWTHTGDRLQAGTYVLSQRMTPAQIEHIIATGGALSTDITVTIPEGMNTWDIDRILLNAGLIRTAGAFSAIGENGYLFPDTYRFAKDATVADIRQRMRDEFRLRAPDFTPSEVIIASILEKEAKTPTDMALVAGIIERRIAQGMPLQIDSTVAYGWCIRTAGLNRYCDVTQAPIATEINRQGPFNTYLNKGLPAEPISNPGLAALNAAAHPTASPYLYYLSTRDGSQIIYAKTPAEQALNRAKYLGL